MKLLLIIQGEGRGHMTQALAFRVIMDKYGHEVVGALVGKSSQRKIPSFFLDNINTPVTLFESPNFVLDGDNKGLRIRNSFKANLKQANKFIKSIKVIDKLVVDTKPDIIINFYDLLGGLYSFLYKRRRSFKFISISHHFLIQHRSFPKPEGMKIESLLLITLNKLTSLKSDLVWALSFGPMAPFSNKKYYIIPPLLRKEVFSLQSKKGEFILGYILNWGYWKEIEKWHKNNSNHVLHVFWDKPDAPVIFSPHENLNFHLLNDTKFLELMASCKGLITTAGFESVSEAMYLGKPVLIVPTANHYEQLCNAMDAERVQAGISAKHFNISKLLDSLPYYNSPQKEFQAWVNSGEKILLELLTQL